MSKLWLLVLAACLSACVTVHLTPEAEAVRVTSNPEAVHGCTLVGPVTGADHKNGGLVGQGAANENAVRDLKNKAVEIGANTVLMVTATTSFSGSTQRGEGYRCPR